MLCPVCREPINYDLKQLKEEPEPLTEYQDYLPNQKMQLLQREMQEMYLIQKSKGGIIDVEEEKNKFFLPAKLGVKIILCIFCCKMFYKYIERA